MQCLDLRAGHGTLLGPLWETDSPWLGAPWTRNTGLSPSAERASSLWQILEQRPPPKYFLSQRACRGILLRSEKRGKPLPPKLEWAAFHINQRDEVIDTGNITGALMAVQNMQMQTFVASFSAGAGKKAGGISYSESIAPTLKASPSGNMAPSVLCLSDQGGQVMDWSENVSATLRSQEHGHQPAVLLFDNHGQDCRYDGPLDMAPTMQESYGTGGNNTPLVVADGETPQLIRRLTPLECERLQGFPDGWTDLPGASDSARYRALGNSVAIPCVEFVLGRVKLAIEGGEL